MTSSEPSPTHDDRRIGAILGLAVGDALGATYEFYSPEDVPKGPLEIVGGGWLNLKPGETTDDTALARAVLEGYQEGPLDLRRVRYSMLRWEDSDPKDIGNQTSNALDYLSDHPEALSLPDDPDAQGNGAVIRAAPHGVMTETPEQAVDKAWAEANLTHPSWEARASSALVAGLVAFLIEGQSPQEALETSWSLVEATQNIHIMPTYAAPPFSKTFLILDQDPPRLAGRASTFIYILRSSRKVAERECTWLR